MKAKIIKRGRIDRKFNLQELSEIDMSNIQGGDGENEDGICVCDARWCIDCTCVLAGPLCICDVNRNCT
jgi:hypothetical protein